MMKSTNELTLYLVRGRRDEVAVKVRVWVAHFRQLWKINSTNQLLLYLKFFSSFNVFRENEIPGNTNSSFIFQNSSLFRLKCYIAKLGISGLKMCNIYMKNTITQKSSYKSFLKAKSIIQIAFHFLIDFYVKNVISTFPKILVWLSNKNTDRGRSLLTKLTRQISNITPIWER